MSVVFWFPSCFQPFRKIYSEYVITWLGETAAISKWKSLYECFCLLLHLALSVRCRMFIFIRVVWDLDKCLCILCIAIMVTCFFSFILSPSLSKNQKPTYDFVCAKIQHTRPTVNRYQNHCKMLQSRPDFLAMQLHEKRIHTHSTSGKLNGAIVNVNNLLAILMNCPVAKTLLKFALSLSCTLYLVSTDAQNKLPHSNSMQQFSPDIKQFMTFRIYFMSNTTHFLISDWWWEKIRLSSE